MSQIKPADFSLLLDVFRDGLRYGVIVKEEIIAWADGIIMAEDEPDYFFIELSLCADSNKLLGVLGEYVVPSVSIILPRVLLGVAYKKLVAQQIDIKTAVSLLDSVNDERLTMFERSSIYSLDDDYYDIMYQTGEKYWAELTELVMSFLVNYKDFALDNYEQWPEINLQVNEALVEAEAKAKAAAEEFNRTWKENKAKANATFAAHYKTGGKREIKRKRKLFTLFSVPVILIVVIVAINYDVMRG